MSWFHVSDGRLRFRGRFSKHPVNGWLASVDGVRAVDGAAREVRFALLGRKRAARHRLGRDLWHALNSPSVREMVEAECNRYVAAWSDLAYAPSLPRVTVALHRLVVIPRAMIPGRAGPGTMGRVESCPGFAGAVAGFKAFFWRWLLGRMDDAIRRAGPSPGRPVHAGESWACVAIDEEFTWVDPEWSGPEWRGHVVMFEMPDRHLARRGRRELQAAIEQLTRSLPNLTRQQREVTVRAAADQMRGLTHARAAIR